MELQNIYKIFLRVFIFFVFIYKLHAEIPTSFQFRTININNAGNKNFSFVYATDIHGSEPLPSMVSAINNTSSKKHRNSLPLILNGDIPGDLLGDAEYDNDHIYTVFNDFTNTVLSNVGNH